MRAHHSLSSHLVTAIFFFLGTVGAADAKEGKGYVYPDENEGGQTASGEMYQHEIPTAGHAWLPFGTMIRVRNLNNGRVIDVKVNDRRSHRGQLVILSQSAARELEMLHHRVADVSIERIGFLPEEVGNPSISKDLRVGLQPGSITQQASMGGGKAFGKKAVKSMSKKAVVAAAPPLAVPFLVMGGLKKAKQVHGFVKSGSKHTANTFWLEFLRTGDRNHAEQVSRILRFRGAPVKVYSPDWGKNYHVLSLDPFASEDAARNASTYILRHTGYQSAVRW